MIRHISLLALATMIWGAGFIASKWTFKDFDVIWANTLRFVFGSIFILPILLPRLKGKPLSFYKGPLICSAILLLAMQTQTIGIKYTTAAKSGFLTTFYALFTPLILMFTQNDRYQKSFWFLLSFALFGIALMCELDFNNFNKGDLWILVSAVCYSFHIILIFKYARDYSPIVLNGLQCVFVLILALPPSFALAGVPDLSVLWQPHQLSYDSSLSGFLFLGLFSSNVAFTIQAYSQKFIPPHIVGLVFLMESLFAAFFGYIFLDEKLTVLGFTGAGFVLIAISLIPRFGRKINPAGA